MATLHLKWYSFALFVICVAKLRGALIVANEERKDYIIYMGALPSNTKYSPKEHHMSMLQKVVNSSYARQSMIRSYTRSFNGFAAHLTDEEAKKLSTNEHVVSIFPSKNLQLHTTKSWDFMGFSHNVHRNISVESDIIIGVLDTGIWPESESFNDHGFGPIPKKWKGDCQGGKDFSCNKKIIGARSYFPETSCRDLDGHGSHTASIAAGHNVKNASFFGIAKGIARGGVPSARIAVYKVCVGGSCSEIAILAAFDDAIADGVDILSVSLGAQYPMSLEREAIALGSFYAAHKGILTVQSAGNGGPETKVITSNAPWLFTVAASTINRKIISKVVFGDGTISIGYSINSFKLHGTQFPVVYGTDASKKCRAVTAKFCMSHCLDEKLVKGKIVLCRTLRSIEEAGDAGALGLISLQNGWENISFVFPYATSILNEDQFKLAESYYNSTKSPTMNILKSEIAEDLVAPIVAIFSSRGPNPIIPDILKPDIAAPGVEILAAFSPESSPSDYSMDKRSVSYNILSGTSMSCPHVTGAAVYVKSLHPDWSFSAIKSALMTTASSMNATNAKYGDTEFSYGAGHLDPVKAVNPGIVYETSKEDYTKFLCSMNITSSKIAKIIGYNVTCTDVDPIKPKDLNYPSMAAQIDQDNMDKPFKLEFPRTVTNVGLPNSTYKAMITTSSPCNITVVPSILSFKKLNEPKSFIVTMIGEINEGMMISASLEWSDGIHVARSPIVVYVSD